MNAAIFAQIAHAGQRRKTGDDVMTHLSAVRDLLREAGVREPYVLDAALLHDCMEDAGISKEYLAFRFGPVIAEIVDVLSKEKLWRTGYCRMQSNLTALESAWPLMPEATVIKIADRIHNVRTVGGFSEAKRREYLRETTQYLIPLFGKMLEDGVAGPYANAAAALLDTLQSETAKAESSLSRAA